MTITSCGPICDVGGEYILLEMMREFTVKGIPSVLLCCETHEPALKEAVAVGDWQQLPPGPLRSAFDTATIVFSRRLP